VAAGAALVNAPPPLPVLDGADSSGAGRSCAGGPCGFGGWSSSAAQLAMSGALAALVASAYEGGGEASAVVSDALVLEGGGWSEGMVG
jgi:hypothetical protein